MTAAAAAAAGGAWAWSQWWREDDFDPELRAQRMRTAREEQCRKLGLPTPGEAQTTEVVRLRSFLSDEELNTLDGEIAQMQAEHCVGQLQRGPAGRPHVLGEWTTSYLHTAWAGRAAAPASARGRRNTR